MATKAKRRLFEHFMDEYTGKADARRVREAAKKPPEKTVVESSQQRVERFGMSSYRVQALEQENHALRLQLAAQQHVTVTRDDTVSEFEQAYNRSEPEPEEAPRGRKIILDPE